MSLSALSQELLSAGSPHGYCLLWSGPLVYLHVISNLFIALAYIAIPISIYQYLRHKSQHVIAPHLFWLFALFIISCALTHLMGILVIWQPYYYLQGVIMAFTALVSIAAARESFKLIPDLLSSPTSSELADVNNQLEKEVLRRRVAEEQLLQLNKALEDKVAAELALNRQKDHLLIQQSRLASMGEMIGNIAHQWRQPLTALSTVLINIIDAYEHKELSAEYLNKQIDSGNLFIKNMSSTIDDFRNLFKPDKHPEQFNISQCINEALKIVEASYKSHNIEIQVALDETLYAYGFVGEYRQVVLNLLGNAKNAIVENRVTPGIINVQLNKDHGAALCLVHDNGGGIAEDIIEKIFDPYFTTRTKGTGIGLYMSKMIVENNMHGNISAINKERGALFCIKIALAQEKPQLPLLNESQVL